MTIRAAVVAALTVAAVAVGPAGPASAGSDPGTDPTAVVTAARDWDGDGHPDLTALTPDGRLFVYRTVAGLQFAGKPWLIASGLRGFTSARIAGDLDEDGDVDILARGPAGALWVVLGTPGGRFGGMARIPGNWSSYEEVVPVDLDVDGKVDLIGFDHATGTAVGADSLRIYMGRSGLAFRFGNLVRLSGTRFDSMSAFGDSDGDGYLELLVRNRVTGELWALETNGTFSVLQHKSQHRVVGTVGGQRLPTLSWFGAPNNDVLAGGDITGDGLPDTWLLQRSSDWLLVVERNPDPMYTTNWIVGRRGWSKLQLG